MNKKCLGCGSILQDNNPMLIGYTDNLTNTYCKRCFRMRNYGEYMVVPQNNKEYINLLQDINNSKSLVLFVIDILNFQNDFYGILDYLKNNPCILVINKRDVLPLSIRNEKILDYFKNEGKFLDYVIVSAKKNFNIDNLISTIDKYRVDDKVYFVGATNAGKSTLINKIISDYSITLDDDVITTSPLPQTTLKEIVINFRDYKIIDTPGVVSKNNILNDLSSNMIKMVSCKEEIKPITFRIFKGQTILIGDFIRIDYNEDYRNSFTLFMSNKIKIRKVKTSSLEEVPLKDIKVLHYHDLVVEGLGFIKIIDDCNLKYYSLYKTDFKTRKSLI